jgi:hypothetical protein
MIGFGMGASVVLWAIDRVSRPGFTGDVTPASDALDGNSAWFSRG